MRRPDVKLLAPLKRTLPGRDAGNGREHARGSVKPDPIINHMTNDAGETSMKSVLFICSLIPVAAVAAASWDGTWRTKIDTFQVSGKPDIYAVNSGKFHCASCKPAISIPADGKDHAVTGHPYYDTVNVRVVDASTVQWNTASKGKVVFESTLVASADHNTLDQTTVDHTGAQVATYKGTAKRVGPMSAGAHAVSGQWQQEKSTSASDAGTTVTIATTADGIKMTYNGWVTDAKFDGKPVEVMGDPGHTMSAFKRLNGNTIQETDTRDGKVTDTTRYALASDGQSIKVADQDRQHGTMIRYTMQPVH